MSYEQYFICIDPGSEYSGCVVLGVEKNPDGSQEALKFRDPNILWGSKRKEGTDKLTKTGKLSKGTTKHNYYNAIVFEEAIKYILKLNRLRESTHIFFLIERPESRMAIFDSKTIMATEWTGRFIEKAYSRTILGTTIPPSDIHIDEWHGINPSEVRHLITGKRGSNPEEVYIKTREFFDNPDKYEGVKSHARSALNLYVAYHMMRKPEAPHV